MVWYLFSDLMFGCDYVRRNVRMSYVKAQNYSSSVDKGMPACVPAFPLHIGLYYRAKPKPG